MRAPVAIMAFNRPELLARVFAAVRAARPPRLFLICDGARANRPGEAERVADVRRLLDAVDWPCEVERNYAASNLGCRRRVSSGIEWVFSRTEEAIFLEDDTLPDASFFPFCDDLLARYRDDERVQMISGFNLLGHGARDGASYWFSAYPRIWGWASWKRAWRGYDVEMTAWPSARQTSVWTSRNREEQEAWGPFFDAVRAGAVDTWDAQVTLHAWDKGQLSVIPSVNLTENIGFGPGATNTHALVPPGPAAQSMVFPLSHPASVLRGARLDAEWLRRDRGSRRSRVRAQLKRAINWVRGR